MATDEVVFETIKVLYVEDDETCAGLTLEYLKRDKYTKFDVVQVCTLTKGLKYLEELCNNVSDKYIDIILLDLILPNSKGVATYKSVVETCNEIPVVIVSAHEDLAIKCVSLGAQDYLIKPNYTQDELTRSIRYAYERKKLEKEKLNTEKKFRNVIHNTPVGFHTWELKDDQLLFKGSNPSGDKILGLNHKELLGEPMEKAFPGLKGTPISDEYKKVIRTGNPFSEVRLYSDYRIKPTYFKINAFKSEENCVTVSFENISEQIETQEKYKNLVEATDACIYEVDFKNKKFKYVNHVLAKKLGYTQEEMMSMKTTDMLTENSIEKWRKRTKALKNGEWIDRCFECELLTKNYEIIDIMCTCEFIEDENNELVGINVVAIDITEMKKAKEEAKLKEEQIFNQLEDRIHQWRNELTIDLNQSRKHRSELKATIKNLNGQVEVL